MFDPGERLATVFGFTEFRPGQAEIIDTILAGDDTLAILPTGAGKSLCFQIPALCRSGLTLVISPLIALMRDQVASLTAAGVGAGSLTSGNTEAENGAVFERLNAGEIQLLYMAPERLAGSGTVALLRRLNVTHIAVDEAHCVSQWGHDFRPDYLRIGELRRALGVSLSAFTATADEETRAEIMARLFSETEPKTFLHGFDRPNIRLAFQPKNNPRKQILDFAAARRGQSGIVYCGTRAKTETLAKALAEELHTTCSYHGGMEREDRRNVEERFQREDGLIVVATVAFGMGVDKPDIRWVAHADLPKSIEAYYQEIGRGGRDGAAADTLTLYGADDIRLRRSQIDEGMAPDDRKFADHGRLNALLGLADALGCRRQLLLGYFGEESEPCGNCDLCEEPPELFDATDAARKALSAVLRTGEYFGTGHLVDVLLGNETDKVTQRGHHNLPTFGVGTELDKNGWQSVFRQMMGQDFLRPDSSRFGALRMTERARPVLKGEEGVTFRRDVMKRSARRPAVRMMVSEDDAPLLSALKAQRRALAEAARVPAYVVFTDKTLIELAEKRPQNLDEMMGISGIGATKLDKFGSIFLKVITGAGEKPHPARQKLAGQTSGLVFDRLQAAQVMLMNGEAGTEKPMSCSSQVLARLAKQNPTDLDGIERVLGERHCLRFGPAFLEILLNQ